MIPLVIAHRGASYVAPENTLAAFRAARELGADGFETDVQLTRDGKLVMHHNYTIDANSDGAGKICELLLEEVRQYDFGAWKGNEFAGERIPVLQECLDAAAGFQMVNIELKAPMDRSIPYVKPVAEAIEASGLGEKIIVSAFDHSLLRELKQYLPEQRVGALTLPPASGNAAGNGMLQCFPMDIPVNEITREKLRLPKEDKLKGNALGVNGKDMGAVLLELANAMAAMFPGKSFAKILEELKKQADLDAYIDSLDFRVDYLHCEYHSCLADPTLVEKMHRRGVGVNTWTVDTQEDMRKILAMKPDGIITNRPDLLLALRDNGTD